MIFGNNKEEEVPAASAAAVGQEEEYVAAEVHDTEKGDEFEEEDLKKQEFDREAHIASFPMRSLSVGPICFNPFTSLLGIVILWGVAVWCMVDPDTAVKELVRMRQQSAFYFSWFYVGTRPVWMFYICYVAFRYGDVRLGPPGSKPEFSAASYFAMLFAAGVAVGLFFYGVSEPMWHQSSHWYGNEGYHSQDAIDQFAMNQTIYHWGLSGWAGYLVVALACGLASYRFNLPMTLRSGLYPLLGEYTWGWLGDVIDGSTIVVTVAGVCTSLGLGAMQIVTGLKRIKFVDDEATEEKTTNIQIMTIWVITFIATASVISGLHFGIKYLSDVAFGLGMVLLFIVIILEHTPYLFNLIVQTIGYYFQYSIFLIPAWTDAFGQLRAGEGRAVDGLEAAVWWMDAWTIFYMAWWTAWSGFVGLFVARISKGRTVREVVLFGFLCPLFYCFLWFGVFGGVGLRQSRQALELQKLGEDLFNNTEEFLVQGSTVCYDVPQQNIIGDEGEVLFTNHWPGITPVCGFDSGNQDSAWFNVMYSFSFPEDLSNGMGGFLSVISIMAIGIYFITSSDSGSLIVDHMASNGQEEHHWLQRLFWALTEGSVACALLKAGGADGLKALQAASIITGLPYTVIMCYMLQSIEIMCSHAQKSDDMFLPSPDEGTFATRKWNHPRTGLSRF